MRTKTPGLLSAVLAWLVFALSLGGCGQSGSLTLPDKAVPQAAAGTSGEQDDDERARKRQDDARE